MLAVGSGLNEAANECRICGKLIAEVRYEDLLEFSRSGGAMSRRMHRRKNAGGKSRSELLVSTTTGNSLHRIAPRSVATRSVPSLVITSTGGWSSGSRWISGIVNCPSSKTDSRSLGKSISLLSISSMRSSRGREEGSSAVPSGPV